MPPCVVRVRARGFFAIVVLLPILFTMRSGRTSRAGCLLLAVASLSACVPVNERPKTGLTYAQPATGDAVGRVPGASRGITDSRVTVSMRPLGAVPFDGMTLPVISPDGRYVATQSGATPGWETLLAEPAGRVPGGLRISAAEIRPPLPGAAPTSPGEPTGAIVPLGWSGSLPRGVLLGRSANERGVLIERPEESGARSIGIVDWATGQIEWVVREPGVLAAQASFGPSGELAFSRRYLDRPAEGAGCELVVRRTPASSAGELVLAPKADETLVFPTFSADRARVYVFSAATRLVPGFGPLTLLCVRLPVSEQGELVVERRVELDVEPTAAAAFQAVVACQTPWVLPGALRDDDDMGAGIAIVDQRVGGMSWIDARSGSMQRLATGTAGAVPWWHRGSGMRGIETSGLILGAAKELVFQPRRAAGGWGAEVSVVAGASIPRLAGTLGSLNAPGGGASGRFHGGLPRFVLLCPPQHGRVASKTGGRGQDFAGMGMVQLIEMVPVPE